MVGDLVVGDLMIDEYLRGHARRISQESPVMVVEVEADDFKPGGAANVGTLPDVPPEVQLNVPVSAATRESCGTDSCTTR